VTADSAMDGPPPSGARGQGGADDAVVDGAVVDGAVADDAVADDAVADDAVADDAVADDAVADDAVVAAVPVPSEDRPAVAATVAAAAGSDEVDRRTAFNAVVSAGADVAGKVATFAYTVLAVRWLTQADYGAFAYALSVSLLVSAVPAWGWDTVLVQRGAADRTRLGRLLADTLAWKSAVGIPLFLAVGLIGTITRPGREAQIALALVLVATLLDLYDDANRNAAAAVQRMGGASAALIGQRLVTAVLAVAALVAGTGLVGLAAAYLAGSVVGTVAMVVARRRLGIRADLAGVSPATLRDLVRGTLPVGLLGLLAMALFRVDVVILEALRGDAEVAAYSAAYRLVETVLFIAWAMGRAVFPVMSAASEAAPVRRAAEQAVAAVAAVYVPFAAVAALLATPVLELLYGPAYAAEAAGTLRWLAPTPLLFAFTYLLNCVLLARDRSGRALVGTMAAAALNVVVNVALVPRFGATGAAAATTLSYAAQTLVLLALTVQPGTVPRLLQACREAMLAGLALVAALVAVPGPPLSRLAVGAAVYAVAWIALVARSTAPHLALARSIASPVLARLDRGEEHR
jgi:O-antigen/teichoic acid export membrane protein